jgi:hypothetical protein
MEKSSPFTISVLPFDGRPGRYRWLILENGKDREKSRDSFATSREAHLDAERHVDRFLLSSQRDD